VFAADPDIWRWQPHADVWLLVVCAVGLAAYAVAVIGPKAVKHGPIVTRGQVVAFCAAIGLLWLASDWPLHDIAEEYLYSAHMVQHMIISMVVPPLFLLATPEWLARLVLAPNGEPSRWVKRVTHPVFAGVVFNAVVIFSHLPAVVSTSIDSGLAHYLVHVMVLASGVLMWMPVLSPMKELRISRPGQMVYLFCMSLLPTIPAGFLTFAPGAIYESYDHGVRVWGITVTEDQQMAGLVMKLAGGLYLWAIIGTLFFRWAADQMRADEDAHKARRAKSLTYASVEAEFEKAGEPVKEPSPPAA
jgi:putative membrane protein